IEKKGEDLLQLIEAPNQADDRENLFLVQTKEFDLLPASPFAYWVSNTIRWIFEQHPSLEDYAAEVRVGVQTGDDFRFVRCWWEVDGRSIGYTRRDTNIGLRWMAFSKGGPFSPYYSD